MWYSVIMEIERKQDGTYLSVFGANYPRGDTMQEKERQAEQRAKNKFNNRTTSQKVQNQNEAHNSRKEGLGANTKR